MVIKEQDIRSLVRQLQKHAANWKAIGIHLGFLPSDLDNIESAPNRMQGAPLSYLGAMLQEWSQWAPGDKHGNTDFANLKDLKSALKEAGFGATACDLKLQ